MLRANYHTHTYLCKHASGDIADYCKKALQQHISILGFSDHMPIPDNRWHEVRMSCTELSGYCERIDQAKKDFPDLEILKALECEYIPEFKNFQREILLGKYKLDYLVQGNHNFLNGPNWESVFCSNLNKRQLHLYTDSLITAMHTGLYAFIAHPDAFGTSYLTWDNETTACSRAILSAAEETHIPLELNTYGLRKPPKKTPNGMRPPYPLTEFWKLAAEYKIDVLINSDAHHPIDVWGNNDDGYDLAKKFQLNIVNESFYTRLI